MADVKFLANIDLNDNQLLNMKLQHLSSDPTGVEGQLFYHSGSNVVKFYDGSNWIAFGTATGDITGVDLTGQSGGITIGSETNTTSGDYSATLTLAAANTVLTSVLNSSLVVGRDAHNQIKFSTDDQIIFRVGNADGVTFKASGEIEAASLDISGNADIDGTLETDALSINGTTVTSTAAELNILDGVTSTAAELNILDGVTSTAAELNILDGVTSTAAELNILDGVTSTAAELNVLDGITAVVGELNALDIGSTAVGTAVASKAVILDSNKDYTGIRNLTIAGLTTGTGRIIVDDTTNATSTTNGSLQTDGGLSVALDAVIGDDLIMLSDSAQISFGANKEVALKHEHNKGLILQHSATADGSGTTLTLQSAEAVVTANEEIAALQFDPSDSDGTDGTAISARIAAIAEGTFSASNNATRLEFQLGASEAASTDTKKMTLSSAGLLTITDDLVIKGGGTIGGADDTDLLTLGSAILTVAGEVSMTTLDIGGTNVTSTAAELNILDGVTSTAAELNILDGVTSTAAELNILDGVTSTAAELNILDGVTSTAAELNVLDGITAVVGELNALDIGSTAVGTAVASKAVILDSNKDYTGIRNLTITGNLSVTGTTTQVNTVTMNAENAVVFEGATADSHETTLTIVDPTADHTYKLPDLGSTADEGFIAAFAADPGTSPLITSTPTELNLLDGVTSTTAELNILDGVTSTAAELNILDGVTSTAAELNILDGVTSTAAELNILDGVTSTAAELNILDGVTATAAEINLIDGGTSRGTTAVANGDGFLHNDGGTMRMTNVSKLADLLAGTNISASSSVLSVANASASAKGVVELATTAEALAGTDTSRAVTAAGLAARSAKFTIGDGSDQDITLTHNLGTRDVVVQMYDASDYKTVYAEVVRTDANNITVNTNDGASIIASNDVIVLVTKID